VAALIQFLRHRHGLRPIPKDSALPSFPTNPFYVGGDFGASLQFACATTYRLGRSPDGSDSAHALPARTFTSRLPPERSPDCDVGYGYRGYWIISTGRTLTDWICSWLCGTETLTPKLLVLLGTQRKGRERDSRPIS